MTNTQPIEYVKDTFEEYLSKKTHISASDIKNFMHSPKFYYHKAYEEVKEVDTDTRHFSVGSAIHEVILEPHLFRANYVVTPKFDRRTKVGRQEYQDFIDNLGGKTLLYEEEMEMVLKMGEQSAKNDTLVELIRDSYREVSCYTMDEKTGLKVRLRPDSMAKRKSTITDIKSCLDSSYVKFKKDVYSHGYSTTASFYMDYLNKENYVFCAIEKQAPYQTSLFVLDDEKINYGRAQYRVGLDLLKWSIDNNYWCDYTEFMILKECYELGNLDNFFEIKDKSEKIIILK